MSHPRKRHASMMENQKKAAEAEAAQTILTAVSSVSAPDSSENSASEAGVVESEQTSATEANIAPSATHATATAPVQHEDFGEESSDDSESGIAFLSPAVGAPSVGKKTRGPAKEKGAKTNNTAAAAAAVMSLQRTHWTKEMVRICDGEPVGVPLEPALYSDHSLLVLFTHSSFLHGIRMRCCCTLCPFTMPRTGSASPSTWVSI